MTINKTINQKSKKHPFYTLAPLLLISCTEDLLSDEQRAINTARATKYEIHDKYLACYALSPAAKKICTDGLNAEYPNIHGKESQEYILSFQYEAEKLGFKHFLNNLDLKCENIEEGPLFIEERQAYQVTCKPAHQYLMRFNYETKEWQLVAEENKTDGGDHE